MIRKFIVVLGLVVFPLVLVADRLSLKAGAPEVYTVKKGDTLWDISLDKARCIEPQETGGAKGETHRLVRLPETCRKSGYKRVDR